ncbi:sulfurtransferase [Paraliomyxa miuraensis]|uniref:sulfurtransferase n=1 Tax=Paraliomyxa miuraensis TaxID=376150 RepID=UPI0022553DAB|nr:sulfurtransferase [Paraliomyxa miuraensis]MCX4248012.1 sulfurtransferase [Paraliomyxa miuraensis]
MSHETIVDVKTLAASLGQASWRVVDCRFALADPEAGARLHAQATIPGAIHAHLDRDLSGPVIAGRTGRHPLPTREAFAATLGGWGITAGDTQVVAFDDIGGAFAARLWWMLRWVGHRAAAVLDGGLGAWEQADGALAPGRAYDGARSTFALGEPLVAAVSADELLAMLDDPDVAVLDARAAARYRGEGESTDPVAGHIAGARSAPFVGNLGEDGRFLTPERLRARYREHLAGTSPENAIAYCGSGVTACHDLLAMTHAGLPTPRLYPGSWSEWITDPSRPRATGDEAR